MAHFLSFNIDGKGNPKTVRIQIGDPIGARAFARERTRAASPLPGQRFTHSTQRFPPRQLPQGKTRNIQ